MDMNLIIALGIPYVILCVIVGSVADGRGHGMGTPFAVCFFCSPLIGAILYGHYKPKEQKAPE